MSLLAVQTLYELEEQLHPVARPVYRAAVLNASVRPNVDTVARTLGCSPRCLERRFAAATLPPPQRLVRTARWLPVVQTLAQPEYSTRTIARALGFPTTQALCKAATREIGTGIRMLRAGYAVAQLERALIDAYGDGVSCG